MINIHKYNGSGNDFIMINNLDNHLTLSPIQIAQFCDRHFGIGADGVILLESSNSADCFMNYYNSDGTIAEMCGNGVRCTAKFFQDETSLNKKELEIETRDGIKKIILNEDGTYSVNMGMPVFQHSDFPDSPSKLFGIEFNFVSMGNPHAIGFVNNLDKFNIKVVGPEIENDCRFPNKINMELAEKIDDKYYKVKVWERGCGATLACGTGACAVYSTICKLNEQTIQKVTKDEITLEFPGGKLFLSSNEQGHIILRGPAEFVFKGEI